MKGSLYPPNSNKSTPQVGPPTYPIPTVTSICPTFFSTSSGNIIGIKAYTGITKNDIPFKLIIYKNYPYSSLNQSATNGQ